MRAAVRDGPGRPAARVRGCPPRFLRGRRRAVREPKLCELPAPVPAGQAPRGTDGQTGGSRVCGAAFNTPAPIRMACPRSPSRPHSPPTPHMVARSHRRFPMHGASGASAHRAHQAPRAGASAKTLREHTSVPAAFTAKWRRVLPARRAARSLTMLTRLKLRNFKLFEEIDLELGRQVVLIGPNNAGKTTALQALALWDIGLKRWLEKRGAGEVPLKRPGVTINRREPDRPAGSHRQPALARSAYPHRPAGERQDTNAECAGRHRRGRGRLVLRPGVRLRQRGVVLLPAPAPGGRQAHVGAGGREEGAGSPTFPRCPASRPTRSGSTPAPSTSGSAKDAPPRVLRNLCHRILEGEDGDAKWGQLSERVQALFGSRLDAPEYIAERGRDQDDLPQPRRRTPRSLGQRPGPAADHAAAGAHDRQSRLRAAARRAGRPSRNPPSAPDLPAPERDRGRDREPDRRGQPFRGGAQRSRRAGTS